MQQPHSAEEADGKKLPPRPMSNESDFAPQLEALHPLSPLQDPQLPLSGTPSQTSLSLDTPKPTGTAGQTEARNVRESFLTGAIRQVEGRESGFLGPLWERSKSPLEHPVPNDEASRSKEQLTGPDAPRPLTPLRSGNTSPVLPPKDHVVPRVNKPLPQVTPGDEPASWLNTFDDSDSESCASLHEGVGGQTLRRKDLRIGREDTASSFDAAFDAAVEAAYEEGYEPDQGTEDELLEATVYGVVQPIQDTTATQRSVTAGAPRGTMDYANHGFDFNLQPKPVPRGSDSSGYSSHTYQSSARPERTTGGTSLTTLSEDLVRPPSSATTLPTATPQLEVADGGEALLRPTSSGGNQILERRSQRLSGPNLKPLKIETSIAPEPRQRAPSRASVRTARSIKPSSKPNIADVAPWEIEASSKPDKSDVAPWESADEVTPWVSQAGPTAMNHKVNRVGSLRRQGSDAYTSVPTSARSDSTNSNGLGSAPLGDISSPNSRYLRSQKSSISLRDPVVPMTPTDNDQFVGTPLSSTFTSGPYTRRNDSTSHLSSFSGRVGTSYSNAPPLPDNQQNGGYYLFDTSVGTVAPDSSPSEHNNSAPPSLEPCPESALLRPFWLMRSIAGTITHPRGGYLTNRLFMPHEAWLNRSIKLKNVEDKVAALDMLTAALSRFGRVDSCDAEAVLEELQTFEEVMERVQGMLVKKLGGEVGVNGVASMFKDAGPTTDSPPDGTKDGSTKTHSGKSYLSSWRKLRGKNLSGSGGMPGMGPGSKLGDKEVCGMHSVPMTSFAGVERRAAHRREATRDTSFDGPHSVYMAAVARLCDAAQAIGEFLIFPHTHHRSRDTNMFIDQVARQAEDPGLKHSSPTHVGLELSTRHAAEFFGFYICRFVLSDIGVLIDKYVKRSTEWVLT